MTEQQSRTKKNVGRQAEYEHVDVDLAALASPENRERFDTEWQKFFRGYHNRLMDFFSYSIPDWDERDELVQDIFIRAYRAIAISGHGLRSKEAAWSWLMTIGKNLLRDKRATLKTAAAGMERYAREAAVETELRRNAGHVLGSLAEDDESDARPWGGDRATFETRLSQLSDDERRILHFRFIEGLEWSEVAAREGRNSSAIRKQYSRMRPFLRDGT